MAVSEREPDLVIERLPDWNYGAFLNDEVASCIAIGETEQEALNNGMRELMKRAQQKGETMPCPTVDCNLPLGHEGRCGLFSHETGRFLAAAKQPETMPKGEGPAHNVNPQTDRCIRCGRNAFNRKNHPICMTADYIEKCQQFEPLLIDLTHTRSCDALIPGNEESCTCALRWRIRLRTEMEMHNAWRKRAEEAELALQSSQPAASEERTQVTDYLLEALPKFLGTTMDADDMREMAKIISDVEALQSTPSSPPLAPNKPGSGVLSPETIEKAVEIADKFFAGAGAPSDAGQPERERFLAVHEITCELESLAEGKGYPCPELHVSRPLGKALVAYTEKIQRDASNAALEKLRERIQSEVLTLFAPAPRPAEKG